MQQIHRLNYLLGKSANGTINEDERQELFVLLTAPAARLLYNDLFEQLVEQSDKDECFFSTEEAAALLERVNEKNGVRSPGVRPGIYRIKPVFLWAAACMTMLLSLLSYRFFVDTHRVADHGKIGEVVSSPRLKSGVTLTLSDGSQVSLDKGIAKQVFEPKGGGVVNNNNGILTYAQNAETGAKQEVVYNTLTIPRKMQYKLVLPDGSQVWLNAASSLRYPIQFSGGERKVELTGEAYFDIVKDDRKPFLVVTGEQTISVLGTAFNVKAYKDEAYIKTTLTEGSIRLDLRNASTTRLLKPGEQTILKNDSLQVKAVDTREDVSWRSDLFYFSNTDLRIVAYQLQRWYDIEVDFSSLPAEKIYGQIPRSTPLPKLLNAMEKTTGLKFKLSDGRLFVEK